MSTTNSLPFLALAYRFQVLSPRIWAGSSDLLPTVAEVASKLPPGSLGALNFHLGVLARYSEDIVLETICGEMPCRGPETLEKETPWQPLTAPALSSSGHPS